MSPEGHKYDFCWKCFSNLQRCERCGHYICAFDQCDVASICTGGIADEHAVERQVGSSQGSVWQIVRKY